MPPKAIVLAGLLALGLLVPATARRGGEATVNEFAYVLDGEFSVVTKGKGKTVVRKGQIEYAPRGVVHCSLNETTRPARVLVVFLKER